MTKELQFHIITTKEEEHVEEITGDFGERDYADSKFTVAEETSPGEAALYIKRA